MPYLDYNATTPLDPQVLDAMLPFLREKWGNAASRDHAFGWDAQDAVQEARFQVAELIGAEHYEIFFTSGASESIQLGLQGLFKDAHFTSILTDGFAADALIVSPAEHESVREPVRKLAAAGLSAYTLPIDAMGALELSKLERLLSTKKIRAVILMAANNETGVLFPIRECAELAHAHGALLFADCAQALGRIPLDASKDFDLAAFSAHKLCGPKGVGALYIKGGRQSESMEAFQTWGGQESSLTSGTLNVPAIVGFGEACRLAGLQMAAESSRQKLLRDKLENALLALSPEIRINGHRENRLPNTTNIRFPGLDARALIRDMHDIAVSTRSACSSGSSEPSHVLKAMGLSDEDAFASIRFSLGRFTTEAEIDITIKKVAAAYPKLRALSSNF